MTLSLSRPQSPGLTIGSNARASAGVIFRWIVRIFMPVCRPFQPPRLVDDSFEQPSNRPVVQRSAIDVRDVREDLSLARRLVDVDTGRFLRASHLERAGRARR